MAVEKVLIDKRTNNNGTSYDWKHGEYRIRVRFRNNGEMRVSFFGRPLLIDHHQHGSSEDWTNIELVPVEQPASNS